MRILANTLELGPATGIDVHAFQACEALAARGHIVHVVAQREGALRSEYESFARSVSVYGDFLHEPISPTQLCKPWKLSDWMGSMARAVRGSRQVEAEVVYVNSPLALMWACAVSHRTDMGIVCHIHSEIGRPLGRQRSVLAHRVDQFHSSIGIRA